ncbi:6de66c6f-50bd-43e9-8242-d58ca25ba02f-CDS [Sclerotinia trifoliorum]|uniref:6de66c6f-50bd-43e9-8242-d58ca25ba02f-CDS n=1 Tax=Sclerotinia trifoliorum TaxID=28548 RepID=A0A8H2VMB9_9HELO|nr:6de66c6f-50bd-43e9-8242-d58ca25ba02f-CDS [Sclerotinia trifoliorum]
MSSIVPTKSADWWKWNTADLQRKARATRSSDAQDYADRGAAASILAGRKNWTPEQLRAKAEASRYDYDDYDDKVVAQAIRERDRENALKEPLNFERLSLSDRAPGRGVQESSRRPSERMPAPTSSNAGRQNGGNSATIPASNTSTGRTSSQRNTPAPSTSTGKEPSHRSTPAPSTTAGQATSSRERQSAKGQTQTKRDRSKTRGSQPSKILANILPVPSLATTSRASRQPQSSSVGPPSTDGQHPTEHRCHIGACLTRTDGKNILSRQDALVRHYRLVHPESQEGQKSQEAYEKRKRN